MKKAILGALALTGIIAGTPAMAQVGCGIGVSAAYMMGAVDFGAPVNIGSTGQKVGFTGNCDLKMGAAVVGAFGSYEWMLGDMKSIGIKDEKLLGMRAGVMMHPAVLVYGHVGHSWVDTDIGEIKGWKFGPGVEMAVPNTPLALDFRVSFGKYDDVLGVPGIQANTTEARVGLTYRFSGGAQSAGWQPSMK